MSNKPILIHRFKENPLIKPENVPWLKWYPKRWRSVFNCGVIYESESKLFKMLFRGGTRLFSNLGYAESYNGINWNVADKPALKFYSKFFWRGKTTCGIEDPRIVKWIDEYYYIFATAGSISYNVGTIWESGKGSLGIWRTNDFKNFEWVNTPFSGQGKNAAIFSEPLDKYACIIFRKDRDILITKTTDFSLKKYCGIGYPLLTTNQVYRDRNGDAASKIGIAGPPIKTPKGWLVVFHAKHGRGLTGKNFVYSLGFMVLDLNYPYQINYLHPAPILWPKEKEELEGHVKNVVFSCATVDKGDNYIYIYWGGGNTVICGGYLEKSELPMCY